MLARHVLLVVAPYLYSSYISRNVSQTLYTAGADSASYGFLTGKSNAQFPDFNFYANLSPEFCPGNFEPVGPVSTFLVSELEQNNEACASFWPRICRARRPCAPCTWPAYCMACCCSTPTTPTSSRRCCSMATVMDHTPCGTATSKCEPHSTMPTGYGQRI